jgi:hypothetical protein
MSGRQQPEPLLDEPSTYARTAFRPGALVLIALNSPREKFWGALLEISPAGISVRGLDLNSLEDFARQLRAGDPVAPAAVFFPMHRIERMELDVRSGEIPSLGERFESKSGRAISSVFDLPGGVQPEITVGCTLSQAQRRLVRATFDAVGQDFARAAELLDLKEDELRSWLAR